MSFYTPMICIFIHSVVIIGFSPQNYTVPEGTPVELVIVLDRPSVKDISLTVTTMDITADCECKVFIFYSWTDVIFPSLSPLFDYTVAFSDYIGVTFLVTIPAGVVEVTVQVLTLRDPFCEADEYFKATLILQQAPLLVDIGPDTAFVSITDASGKFAVMCVHSTPIISETTMGRVCVTLKPRKPLWHHATSLQKPI